MIKKLKTRYTICCLTSTDEELKKKIEAVASSGKYEHLEIYKIGLETVVNELKISIDK